MRAVGLDLGSRRIGVAVTDAGGRLALPHRVVERCGDSARDRQMLAGIVEELGAEIVVVGLPLQLSGGVGIAAQAAEAEASELRKMLSVPVVTFDERLTTVEAARRRRERGGGDRSASDQSRRGGRSAPVGRRPDRRAHGSTGSSVGRRRPLDAEAATIMLEAWLRGAQ